ncbi:MAG: peptidoglycan editing factor PgeF [Saprospiraceae bacterium]|nr:peptidoglycan editing factor PgeF [Saprospiraceae bacterium]
MAAHLLIRPDIFAPFPALSAAQSTRHGGVSAAPYHSLNLGKSTDDAPENVAENRRRFCRALGFQPEQMAWSKQVHGDQVRLVGTPGGAEGFDALITNTPGILLAVSIADCTPILVYDRRQGAVAAIHAGWRGTAAGIVTKTLEHMRQAFGTAPGDCFAFIGACIDECSFEVGEEVADKFADAFKRFDPARNKFLVDLKKANAARLLAFGIPSAQIEIAPFCTFRDNADFFSHRKHGGITGRGLAAIGITKI